MYRALRILGATAFWAILAVAALYITFAGVYPKVVGHTTTAVLSDSMQPEFATGDLLVSESVTADELQVRDVITFSPQAGNPDITTTHRIHSIALGESGIESITTKGDAVADVDENTIPPEAVVSRVVYDVPAAGYIGSTLHAWFTQYPALVRGLGITLLLGFAFLLWPRNSHRASTEEAPARTQS